MKKIRSFTVLILILVLAGGTTYGLYRFRPQTKKIKPKPQIPLVKTMALVAKNEKLVVEAYGTVVAAKKVVLHPEVEGRIIEQNPELVPGGILPKGTFMVQVDRRDYELKISERQAEVAAAESLMELEKGQQNIASREWQLFKKERGATAGNERLALREPHMKNTLASLDAAKSRLAAAELAESRTTITSPFNALVLEESVETGQLIGPQTAIATLVETDYFWVQVSIPLPDVGRIRFAQENSSGSSVRILSQNGGNGSGAVRNGTVFKLLGDLDPKGRMARILVTVNDPLRLHEAPSGGDSAGNRLDKILLGSYVKVEIEAGEIEDVFVIPRQAMRENEQLWILTAQNTLDIRKASLKWSRKNSLLVTVDIKDGERLITSRLHSPLPGMSLRISDD